MESKGLFKAMGELDVLFNYIESYLASKRHRNHVATAWRRAGPHENLPQGNKNSHWTHALLWIQSMILKW